MNDSANPSLALEPAARLSDLIAHRLRAGVHAISDPSFPAEERGVIQVERGIIFPAALIGDRREAFDAIAELLLEAGVAGEGSSVRVVDGYGHSRPVYRPLLVYCLTQTARLRLADVSNISAGRWTTALAGWRAALQSRAAELQSHTLPATADHGAAFAEMAWIALAVQNIGFFCTAEPALPLVTDFLPSPRGFTNSWTAPFSWPPEKITRRPRGTTNCKSCMQSPAPRLSRATRRSFGPRSAAPLSISPKPSPITRRISRGRCSRSCSIRRRSRSPTACCTTPSFSRASPGRRCSL